MTLARNLLIAGTITDIFVTTAYQHKGTNIGIKMCELLSEHPETAGHVHYYGYGLNTAGEIAGFTKAIGMLARSRNHISQNRFAVSSSYHCQRIRYLFSLSRMRVQVAGVRHSQLYPVLVSGLEAAKLFKEQIGNRLFSTIGWKRTLSQPLTPNIETY